MRLLGIGSAMIALGAGAGTGSTATGGGNMGCEIVGW